jgi:hypothetical protein
MTDEICAVLRVETIEGELVEEYVHCEPVDFDALLAELNAERQSEIDAWYAENPVEVPVEEEVEEHAVVSGGCDVTSGASPLPIVWLLPLMWLFSSVRRPRRLR